MLVEHTLVRVGAERLWRLLAEQMYPDQSLYPANSVPAVIRRVNNALLRAEQVAGWTGTILIARTDALAATLLTSDVDERDRRFLTGERTAEGYHRVRACPEAPIARALAYAPYAELLWCETSTPDLGQARAFADAVHAEFPGKWLAYNCSPSFNWRRHLDAETIGRFQKELASGYAAEAMTAYVRLQQREFELEALGYTATRHQREVGTGVFDAIAQAISGGAASTLALEGSTEHQQF